MVAAPFTDEELTRLRADFPILARTVRGGHPLVYLDSGATSHKPRQVLDAERDFYERTNAAVHRGAHQLSEEGTDAYESARATIARFIGARPAEVVFTRNATEAINLVAYAFTNGTHGGGGGRGDRFRLGPGDEVLVTEMEHHANLIPWQEACQRTGATLRWVPVTPDGRLDLTDLDSLLTERTKVFAFTHVSNVLGTVNPVAELTERAHAVGALVVLDACQSVPHLPVDVDDLGVDFLAFSGHKMFGPLGIGVLWARPELLDEMPVFLTGGSMIETVTHGGLHLRPGRRRSSRPACRSRRRPSGWRRPATTSARSGSTACTPTSRRSPAGCSRASPARPWVRVLGPDDLRERGGAVAFVVDGVHAHDVGQVLDDRGVAVRVGHHCAWPLHRALKAQASTRASFAAYTTPAEVDALLEALDRVPAMFGLEVAV